MDVVDGKIIPLSEENVGISEFLGSHPGFFGIIKQRYSDFLVNEIGSSGEELHLTDIANLPNPPTPVVGSLESTPEISPEVGLPDGVTEEIHQKLKGLASLSESTKSAAETQGSVLVVVDTLSKEQRRAIHQFVQLECEGLVSTTDEVNGQKVIRVAAGSAASLQRERKRRVPRQPKLFTRFLLYKENMDTMEAVSKLASKLRLRAQDVGYAGTKDRRGKTVQLASISKIPPSRIADAARCVPRLRVGNFSFNPDGLSLGQLGGNAFTIVLREVKGSDEEIATAVSSVQSSGVLNYYGLQRFGTQPGHTHIVGKYLLQADWEKATETILKPRPADYEGQERSETLQAWREGRMTSEEAMNKLQHSGCLRGGVERHLIQGILQRGDSDKLGAINCIPRNWRTLYLHAYQAWLWNRLVSRRIKEYGTAVLPGDLVMVSTAGAADSEMAVEEEQSLEEDMDTTDSPEKEEASDAGDTSTSSPTEAQSKGCSRKGSAKLEKLHSCVRPITAEDVHSIKLDQVVIPSVGYAVRLPSNDLADWYREMLKEDDLTMEHLDPKHKSFAVSGAYRPLLLKPKNLSYKIAYYTDPFKSLVISDLDKLNGIQEITLELDATTSSQNSNLTELTSNEVGHSNLQANLAHGKDVDENNAENNQSNGSTSIVSEKKLVSGTGKLLKVSSILNDNKEHLHVVGEEMKPSPEDKDCVTLPEASSSLPATVDDAAPDAPVKETASNKNGSACSEGTDVKMLGLTDEINSDSTEGSSCSAPLADGGQKAEESNTTDPSAPKRLKAVVLQFSLPPAGYATMVLRELLKIDTGSQYHASLNSSQAIGDSKGDRGRGSYRGAVRGDRGRDGRGRSNWTSNRGGGSYRGGDRSHRGGWGRGFNGSHGDNKKRSYSGQKSDRGNNKRPRY